MQQLAFKPKVKILTAEPEYHNMKTAMNMGYKLKITFEGRSMTIDYHASVSDYQNGLDLKELDVLETLSQSYQYHDSTPAEIIDEFGEMSLNDAKAILKEAQQVRRVFKTDENVELLVKYAAGELVEEPTGDKAAFNDDKTELDDDLAKIMGKTTIGDDHEIELIEKFVKSRQPSSAKKEYLLGVTEDGARVYLEQMSWDCSWYFGFGYLETYDPSHSMHSHFDGFNAEKNQDLRSAFLEYFKNGKLTVTAAQSWTLCELMQSFYQLKEAAEIYHGGSSGLTSNPALKASKAMNKKINADIQKIGVEVQKLLSPEGDDPTEILREAI